MTTILELRRRADRALADGRLEDGILAFHDLLALSPGDSVSWYNLGYLLRCVRRFDDALSAYGQALCAGIDHPEEVHLNRAVILSEFRERDGDAEAELRLALAIAPGFVPAWLNLGNLLEDRGDAAAARHSYGQVLAIDPANGRAHARLAAIDLFEGRGDASIPRLQSVLASAAPALPDTAEIGFALGAAHDAAGRYDEAFACFAAANRAASTMAPPQHRYDRARHAAYVDRLVATPPTPEPRGNGSSPIFICGMFRSGSTLVEQILSRHSRVASGGELDILTSIAATLPGYPEVLAVMSDEQSATLRDAYLAEVRDLHPGADLLTDKRPDNFLHIGLIKRLFPGARIVHTVRDRFDTMLSVYFNHFDDSVSYGRDLEDIAHWLDQYGRLMAYWRATYPGDIHDISYDALVRDPEPTIAALLQFCGLAWEDAVLMPEAATNMVRTASVWQVRQRLHSRSSGRWRHYREPLETRFGPLGDNRPDQASSAP